MALFQSQRRRRHIGIGWRAKGPSSEFSAQTPSVSDFGTMSHRSTPRVDARLRSRDATSVRVLPERSPPQDGGRGECRVRASPMARLRKKCRRQVPQVVPNTPAFPARRSSRLYAVSLVRRACWPPFATTLAHCAGHQHRGVRTLRLHVRKRSFVRALVGRRCDLSRPSHPHLACRDDRAQRPSAVRRDAHRQSRFP